MKESRAMKCARQSDHQSCSFSASIPQCRSFCCRQGWQMRWWISTPCAIRDGRMDNMSMSSQSRVGKRNWKIQNSLLWTQPSCSFFLDLARIRTKPWLLQSCHCFVCDFYLPRRFMFFFFLAVALVCFSLDVKCGKIISARCFETIHLEMFSKS